MEGLRSQPLPTRVKLGYGMGQFSEGIAYNFYYYFYTFFLVQVVELSPAVAGIISGLSVLWDAISDPIIGYLSDRSLSQLGRRRSFIGKAAVPFGIIVAVLYVKPPLSGAALVGWICLVNFIFWLFFTICDVPWIILGNELTDKFDEKTQLRTISTALLFLGQTAAVGLAFPVISFFSAQLDSEWKGWTVWGVIIGLITTMGFYISFWTTKGRDTVLSKSATLAQAPSQFSFHHRVKELAAVAKDLFGVKGFLSLFLIGVLATAAVGVFASGSVFVLTDTYGAGESLVALCNILSSLWAILITQLLGKLATKTDKKAVLAIVFSAVASSLFLIWILPHNIWTFYLSVALFFIGDAGFWTLLFSMAGDVTELDEYQHKKKREGLITSFLCFSTKAGCAAGMWLFGTGLDFIGYSSKAVSINASLADNIRTVFFLPIIVCYVGCFLLACKYPYSRKEYESTKAHL